MDAIAYTVIAETASKDAAAAFESWLGGGHIADVVSAGAESGHLVGVEDDGSGMNRFEVRYIFGSQAKFDAYEAGPAAQFRAQGIALFGPESRYPIKFRRTVGRVLAYIAEA